MPLGGVNFPLDGEHNYLSNNCYSSSACCHAAWEEGGSGEGGRKEESRRRGEFTYSLSHMHVHNVTDLHG